MNIPILIAAIITALAFLAHLFVGTRESLSLSPQKIATATDQQKLETLKKNWTQAMCAFQMISIDLLALSALLFVIALTDLIPFEQPIALALSGFYLLWGLVWFAQLAALKSSRKTYLYLGQWLFWFVCAGLLCWGA